MTTHPYQIWTEEGGGGTRTAEVKWVVDFTELHMKQELNGNRNKDCLHSYKSLDRYFYYKWKVIWVCVCLCLGISSCEPPYIEYWAVIPRGCGSKSWQDLTRLMWGLALCSRWRVVSYPVAQPRASARKRGSRGFLNDSLRDANCSTVAAATWDSSDT